MCDDGMNPTSSRSDTNLALHQAQSFSPITSNNSPEKKYAEREKKKTIILI